MYGNWCGPRYGSGKPIDALDTCCQAHDRCYDDSGYFSCACDRQITDCMERVQISNDAAAETQRNFRSATVLYFKSTVCRAGGEWALAGGWRGAVQGLRTAIGRRMLAERGVPAAAAAGARF
ncbi:MAG: phospholipase A2 domain-containing protein [Monoraphidium minutum]|nr:MAG: phospholipase A2 domain-containing protein [Monoraphidium minutum]